MVSTLVKSKKEVKPAFLTSREWEYVLALKYWDGGRKAAAKTLGVTVHAIENKLMHIRKKMDSAYAFKRKYGKLIERRR